MDNLTDSNCEPCRSGAPPATPAEVERLRVQVPLWEIIDVDGVNRLSRVFAFRNFAEALAFTNQVGVLAEAQGHHPALLTEWGRVTVQWWTHKIGGLHRNDFVMAARTDALGS
jgi:4a-hydroxytetrahydrobiopterin dehydratase